MISKVASPSSSSSAAIVAASAVTTLRRSAIKARVSSSGANDSKSGKSANERKPKRSKKVLVVAYTVGLPGLSCTPASRSNPFSTKELIELSELTPRTDATPLRVIGHNRKGF